MADFNIINNSDSGKNMNENYVVLKKLQQARLQLQSMTLKKSGHNKFAGYFYFELGDFLPAVQTIFAGLGLCGVTSYTSDHATLTITDTDNGGEVVFTSPMGSAALKGCHEVQNIGAVETYQRRYLYVTALEIVEHDALDATTGDKTKQAETPPEKHQELSKSVSQDTFDKMDLEAQQFLRDIAMEAFPFFASGDIEGAVSLLQSKKLDADEKVAINSLFDSKQRSAMKKFAEDQRKPKPETGGELAAEAIDRQIYGRNN